MPFSHRSGERIEPLISLQWFMPHGRAGDAGDRGRRARRGADRTPSSWKRVYLDWMENIRPWCISRQLWWGHRIPVWYCDACEETYVGRDAAGALRRLRRRAAPGGGRARHLVQLGALAVRDARLARRHARAARLLPDRRPHHGARHPLPLGRADGHDGARVRRRRPVPRRLRPLGDPGAATGGGCRSSLGTGIDPLEEIDVHGADALRFGLLAMSSTQDVRYSDAKVQQGRDLANKLWNASRLILLNASPTVASRDAAAACAVEDRWILSRLRADDRARSTETLEAYDFAHAALEALRLRLVASSATGTWRSSSRASTTATPDAVGDAALGAGARRSRSLHPVMPFVTEEIWSYHPGAPSGHARRSTPSPRPTSRCSTPRPRPRSRRGIELTRRLRALARPGRRCRPAQRACRRASTGDEPHEFVAPPRPLRVRRRRRRADRRGRPAVEVLASEELDAEAGRARGSSERREELRVRGRRAPRASSPTRASSPRRRPRWSRRSAASSSATAPSSRSSPSSRLRPARPTSTRSSRSAGSSAWSGCTG